MFAFKIVTVVGLVATSVVYGPATPAWAETCGEHMLRMNVTAKADVRYHERHPEEGESPCKEAAARQSSKGDDDNNFRDEVGLHADCGIFRGCNVG